MASWHSKDVGDGLSALGPSSRLHEAFIALVKAGHTPPGIGVFSRYDLRANTVTWYFSPDAELLAKSFGASPCEKPTPNKGFALSVGDSRSWEIHFPGYLSGQRGNEF